VAGLAQQHDAGVREAVEERAERRVVEVRQRLGGLADQLGDR
jgi:hypothetical protein